LRNSQILLLLEHCSPNATWTYTVVTEFKLTGSICLTFCQWTDSWTGTGRSQKNNLRGWELPAWPNNWFCTFKKDFAQRLINCRLKFRWTDRAFSPPATLNLLAYVWCFKTSFTLLRAPKYVLSRKWCIYPLLLVKGQYQQPIRKKATFHFQIKFLL